MKVLDCTLRDAGYYSNWQYTDSEIKKYCEIINDLNIDIVEIGYRNPPHDSYRGSLYYCPAITLERFHRMLNKNIEKFIMLDFKTIQDIEFTTSRLKSVRQYISGVRIAVNANKTDKLNELILSIKSIGLKVCINLMYGHKYLNNELSFKKISNMTDIKNVDVISIVDSYGCLIPDDIDILVRKALKVFPETKLGFHGHNNLNLALSNSIAAIKSGVDIIDSTLGGLGRGAGNLRTEDSILALNTYHGKMAESTVKGLCSSHEMMSKFREKYVWGPEVPYAVAAMKKIPQQVVMDLINLRRLSYLEVIDSYKDNIPKKLETKTKKIKIKNDSKSYILVAGCTEALLTQDILDYLMKHYSLKKMLLCGKNAVELYRDLKIKKIAILPGKEAELYDMDTKKEVISLLPYSRKKKFQTYETTRTLNNPLEVAVDYIAQNNVPTVFAYGFSGKDSISLTNESALEFSWLKKQNVQLVSLTPTSYDIDSYSLYSEMV